MNRVSTYKNRHSGLNGGFFNKTDCNSYSSIFAVGFFLIKTLNFRFKLR